MVSSENLFGFEEIGVDNRVDATLIFEEIYKELEEYLLEKKVLISVFDFLEALSVKVQEEFDGLTDGDSDKKWFVRALTRIFALLLNTIVDTVDKIKRKLKNCR